jgi:hypothetical protein
MVNLLQTQDAITIALDPYMSLEDKLFKESQLGDSTNSDDASLSSTDSEDEKNSESESSSGEGRFNTETQRLNTSSHIPVLETENDGNYSYL